MVSSEIVNEGKSNKIFRKTRKKYPKWTKRVVKVRRITKVIKGLSTNQEDNIKVESEVRKEVIDLCSKFPIYKNLR